MQATISITIFGRKTSIGVLYLLFVLVLLGAFIRFYNLTYTGLWLDEIYSIKGANTTSSISNIYEYSKQDQPPLFFLALHGWFKLFGYTDFSGRALTSVFGILGILAMYFLGKEVSDQKVGLLAAFVTTINWFHVGISIEMRFYALVFLLSTLSYFFYLRSLKNSLITDLACYVVITSFLLNTHYFGMVLFTTQLFIFVVYIIFFCRHKKLIISTVIAMGLIVVSILHWLPIIVHDLQIESFHIKPLTFRYLMKFGWWYVYDPAAFVIYVVCFFLAVKNSYHKIRTKTFFLGDLVIIGWLIVGFLIPLFYSFIRMPLLTNKYCTIVVPAIFLLFAQGFVSIRNNNMKACCVTILLISAAIVLFVARPPYKKSFHEDGREIFIMYFDSGDALNKSWNEDWREVAEFFKVHDRKDQIIFSQLAWFHEYYFKKNSLGFPVNQNECDITKLVSSVDTVWLLLHDHYRNGVDRPIGFSEEQQKIIKENFELQNLVHFRKSKALLYVKKGRHDLFYN